MKKIKYKNTKVKIENKTDKKIKFIPETNINIDQLKKTKIVCPISGCITSNKPTIIVIKKDKKYNDSK